MSLAQLLAGDPRPPWQVLLEALHTSDAIMQDAIGVIMQQKDQLTPDQLDNLTQATERAAKLSKLTIDANVGERRTRLLESQTAIMAGAVQAGLDAIFTTLVERGVLDPQAEVELRQAALEAAAQHAEAAGSAPGSSDRGTQRFTRNASAVRRLQAELPGSTQPGSTQPGSTQPDNWTDPPGSPQPPPPEAIARLIDGARRGSRQAEPEPGPPDLRVVQPSPPPSPLEE